MEWKKNYKSCKYSNRLLEKIGNLNEEASLEKIDIDEIKKAIYYCKKFHSGQFRKSGEPYYTHPLEVAYMVSEYLPKTDILVTSILHDVLEDTFCDYNIMEDIFSQKIADHVMDLTRIKPEGKISSAAIVDRLWIEGKFELLLIKQFDRLHNMLTVEAKKPEKRIKTAKETIESFLVLAVALGIRTTEEQLIYLCSDTLKPKQENNEKQPTEIPYGEDEALLDLLQQNDEDRK